MPITYDDLKHCAALKREISELEEIIARLASRLEGSPPILRKNIGKSQKVEMDDMVIALLELQDIYARNAKKLTWHVRTVERAIDKIKNPDQRRVMRFRYVEGLTWEEVAKKMYFSDRWCQALCERAFATMGISAKEFVEVPKKLR